jgi:hypothetical protein
LHAQDSYLLPSLNLLSALCFKRSQDRYSEHNGWAFSAPWKEVKIIILSKAGRNLKFPQHLRFISLLSSTGKLLKRIILDRIDPVIQEQELTPVSLVSMPTTAEQCNL